MQVGFAPGAVLADLPPDLLRQLAVLLLCSEDPPLSAAAVNKQEFLRQHKLANPSTRLSNDSRLEVCDEKHGFTD